ncbi:tRNA pseudouridine(38-40) synthase TruA [Caulobacter sp. S45]|uniref:tRNA pseudouridine(38-40) synthase TruA n=1 Tax=Caulobacter sp. S45 TaxID=1641861 RepID=UPI0015751D9E|nr:tRNA pseudouridine(38-40) synthase TruA [Caulobacter sp. S45]
MPRYKLTLEYDGGPYRGFQLQDGVPSVQASLERAIAGFCGHSARVHVAGRTDTGVHATGQVAHIELDKAWRPDVVRDALNAHLVPEPISVLAAEVAPNDFHARFSAVGRRYLYRVIDRKPPPVLERARAWWVKTPLDIEAMAQAARQLLGTHDFTTFRDMQCQAKSPVKTLDLASVERVGEEVWLRFAARSFLHRQVRSMTGSLVEVGAGRWTVARLGEALAARDRRACGQVAPAQGLYLTGVEYG